MPPKKKIKNESTLKKKSDVVPKKCNLCRIILCVVVLMVAVASYQAYNTLVAVPDMPEIELNRWWGPNKSMDSDSSIRPYRVLFTDSMQENLRRKFENYRSKTRVKSLDESSRYGLNLEAVAQMFAHWQFKYTFRHRTRYLNKFDHYKTNIQGLDIHYVRVRPQVGPNTKVVPILLLHGWPSSIKEFYDVIPILTSQKLDYDFVFDVIVPSLPGFIYSQAPAKPGLSAYQMAIVMRNLMERLDIDTFYVHGGDIGHTIGTHMATIFPNQVLGFHTSFPVNMSKLAQLAWIASEMWQSIMNGGANLGSMGNKLAAFLEESGYLHLQSTKPDTIGSSLQDSPIGLAAYIVDRILAFTEPNYKNLPDGGLSMFNTTDLLDNVMLYWSTGSITTSLRLYKENLRNCEDEEKLSRIPTNVPTWGLRVKHELIHHSDAILHWKYMNLIGTTTLDVGGQFPAFEIPAEVAGDIFKAVNRFMNLSMHK